tara:strand:- start:3254 stop:3505 length:252 start_codon:yes stop_codon:yes gene_type:complete
MLFQPSAYSLAEYGTLPEEAAKSAAAAGKIAKRVAARRRRALKKARKMAIIVPVAVGGSLLFVGLMVLGFKSFKKKSAKRRAA